MATIQFTEGAPQPPTFAGTPGQLLPNVVDGLAQTRPEALYAMIPKSFTSYEAGFRKVSYRQLANGVNAAAELISKELKSATTSQVLAYVGPNDIGYIVFILGAVKAGHKLLLLSPRNTKADYDSLFNRTQCANLLTLPPPYSTTINNILEGVEQKPRVIHVPTVFELLDAPVPHFPYPKTFEAAKDEALVIVHTSGTTSTPKLVAYTHAFAASYSRSSRQPPPDGYENLVNGFRSQRQFTTFPFFHAGAIQVSLMDAVMSQSCMVTCLAAVPPSAQGIVDALKHVDVDIVHMVAPFMEQMAKSPEMLEFVLPRVKGVTYGGADVSEAAVNAFLPRVNIAGFNGSTETAPYPVLRPRQGCSAADVKYIQPHPVANFQFQPIGMPGFFEGVLVRNKDPDFLQPVFHLFPDLDEFRTRDLFSPHPEKPDLWLYQGRADDMIVSAAGEMCNPVPFEQKLCNLPQVADVLMLGTARYQKGLLVEPTEADNTSSPSKREAFIDSIWPTVITCNEDYPHVNHISRDHILVTQPEMPLKRAGKGTVQRAPTLELYKEAIDSMYKTAGDGIGQNAQPYKVHVTAEELKGS